MSARIRLDIDGQLHYGMGRINVRVPIRGGGGGGWVTVVAEAENTKPQPPLDVGADELVDAIVAHIKAEPDSFIAAGQWITAITNAATQAIREEDRP